MLAGYSHPTAEITLARVNDSAVGLGFWRGAVEERGVVLDTTDPVPSLLSA